MIKIYFLFVFFLLLNNGQNIITPKTNNNSKIYTIHDQSSYDKVVYYVLWQDCILKVTRYEDDFYRERKGNVEIAKNIDNSDTINELDKLCQIFANPPPFLPGGPAYCVSVYTNNHSDKYGLVADKSYCIQKSIIDKINYNKFVAIDDVPRFSIDEINKISEWVFQGKR